MFGAAQDRPDAVRARGRHRGIMREELRIAHDRVERGSEFMTDAHNVTALREIGGLCHLLRPLQRCVSASVCRDLLKEQGGLPVRLLLRDAPAVARQHQKPGRDARDDQENEERRPQCAEDKVRMRGRGCGRFEIDKDSG